MQDDIEVCPTCGALPCDWTNRPRHIALAAETDDLVNRFTAALKDKLALAEVKYGHGTSWASPDWRADCEQALTRHVEKGDPRDVAAYCAFMWHHGWNTRSDSNTIAALRAEVERLLIALHDAIRRPMGVVPESADGFYSVAMADQAEVRRAALKGQP